jgi:hypothetical protein
LMIALQIIESTIPSSSHLQMPLTQVAVICKFIDCGILFYCFSTHSTWQNK